MRVGHELERVAVAGDDHDVDAVGSAARVASVAITSSASTPDTFSWLISSASSTSWINGSWLAKRSGVSLRPAL